MKTLALLLCALSALAADAPAPQQIDAVRILRMQVLEQQATILRLEVCSEVGVKHTECVVDWRNGTATKVAPPNYSVPMASPAAPKPEPTKPAK